MKLVFRKDILKDSKEKIARVQSKRSVAESFNIQEAIFRKLLEADDVSGSLFRFIISVRSFPKISESLASMRTLCHTAP